MPCAGQEQRDQRDRAERPGAGGRSASAATCGGTRSCGPTVWARVGVFGARARSAGGRPPRRARGHLRLDLDHDREDHRPALGLLVQVLRQAVLDLRLEQRDLARCGRRGSRSRVATRSAAPAMTGSSGAGDEAARDDLRPADRGCRSACRRSRRPGTCRRWRARAGRAGRRRRPRPTDRPSTKT